MNNILYIMADQLRFDALGFVKKFPVKTPNIDRLAQNGTAFNNAYCSNPVCVPSRASIMTGVNSYDHGVYYNDQNWPDNMGTWPEKLAGNCYATTLIGKSHFFPCRKSAGFQKMILPEDFDHYQKKRGLAKKRIPGTVSDLDSLNRGYPIEPTDIPLEHYRPVYYTDKAIHELDLMSRRRECGDEGNEPFLMKVSYNLPHTPCNPPEPYFSMYKPGDIPPPVATEQELNHFSLQMKEFYNIWHQMDPDRLLKNRAQYFGCVTLIDEQIGRILKKLQELGIYDNTLIILTADHGEYLCDHHLQQKGSFYEPSVRIPLIFAGPGIQEGKMVKENVSNIDIFPTVLNYCHLAMPRLRDKAGHLIYVDTHESDAMSLIPYLTTDGNGPVNPDRIIISENAIRGQRIMLKKGALKVNYYVNEGADNEIECYNLAEDPDELNPAHGSFFVGDLEPDMKQALEMVLQKSKRHAGGHYYFQGKVRPMFT